MRIALALVGLVLLLSEAVGSEQQSTQASLGQPLKVAQSYCAICGNDRMSCVLRCNGSGACVQNCDNDYRLCVERACRR